jgi:hypothetical protein
MRNFIHFMLMAVLVLGTTSCKKESTESADVKYALNDAAATNFSFLKSVKASNEANQLRSTDYSAPFEITKIDRNKEILNISVTYAEGNGSSKFELIWNGLVMESYPEMIVLYLKRSSVIGTETKPASRLLYVNLTECLGDAGLAQRVKILLCNSSKKANTENSDITISSN